MGWNGSDPPTEFTSELPAVRSETYSIDVLTSRRLGALGVFPGGTVSPVAGCGISFPVGGG